MLNSDEPNCLTKVDTLSLKVAHSESLINLRLLLLEEQIRDHEARLRSVSDGVTQFKVFSGLSSGGSSLISIIALIKSFFNF